MNDSNTNLSANAVTVLVLEGGDSPEREVSLRSAANVKDQLTALGYETRVADPAAADFNLIAATADCDVVLPILHGEGGEDGALQRQLESIGKPFLGSGSAACELTFDKAKYREFMAEKGMLMAEGEIVTREAFEASPLRKAPYVLKPVDGGSSVDTVILHDLADEPDSGYFDELFSRYDTMLLEQLIGGQELTVGILGAQALPIILIVPPSDETFDYENKYNGRTQEIVNPSDVPAEYHQKAKDIALQAHKLTGCRHLSRTDMILTEAGELYVLETNTIPGLTQQSLFPKMAMAAGLDMPGLVKCFVDMANGL